MKLSTVLKIAAVTAVGVVAYKLLTGSDVDVPEVPALPAPEEVDSTQVAE